MLLILFYVEALNCLRLFLAGIFYTRCTCPADGNRWQTSLMLSYQEACNWVKLFLFLFFFVLFFFLFLFCFFSVWVFVSCSVSSVPVAHVQLIGTINKRSWCWLFGRLGTRLLWYLQVPPCTCCARPALCRPGHALQWRLLIHGWHLTCSRVGRASGSLDSIHEIKVRASAKKDTKATN